MKNSFMLIIVLLIGIYWNNVTGQNLNIGESCTVQATRAAGECKLVKNCPQAKYDLTNKGHSFTKCGEYRSQFIVCCPKSITPTPAITPSITQEYKNLLRYKKCVEYSSAVYENTTRIAFVANALPVTTRLDRCGHSAIPLIVGGSEASSKEFPHSAALGYGNDEANIVWRCGGSLVSKRYVLTAGHCIHPRDFGAVKRVRMGVLNLLQNTNDAKPKDFGIEEIIPHPNYTIASNYNDIALLKLNRSVTLNPYIRPICLPFSAEQPGKAIATGWGAVEWAGSTSNSLLKVILEIYQQPECNEYYYDLSMRMLRNGFVGDTQICAGYRNESRNTCVGDSGGPLQIYHPDVYCMYIQTGITSFGMGCESIGTRGVYTRVFYYAEWIESVIWPNGDDQ